MATLSNGNVQKSLYDQLVSEHVLPIKHMVARGLWPGERNCHLECFKSLQQKVRENDTYLDVSLFHTID